MFIDKVKIKVASGKGGNGIVTWRREKFVAHGGPNGGNGGRGGSIYLQATNDMNTLLDFQYRSVFEANDGEKGGSNNCYGKSGEDLIIKVPCGTVVTDPNAQIVICDLVNEGDKVLVAEGGRGGKGNASFKSNKNKAPYFCEPGESGIERELVLELKMIADVGIIGFPNAGKSTLISKISAAKPKIADYPFTTLSPNLGVVQRDHGKAVVVADIPGLIEGASEGIGLGHEFLRHIERTRLLVHLIDIWNDDPLDSYRKLNLELEKYSEKLAKKPQIVVLNKIEAFPKENLQTIVSNFMNLLFHSQIKIFAISAVTGENVEELKNYICDTVEKIPREETQIQIDHDSIARDHDDNNFTIEKVGDSVSKKGVQWIIHCGKLERLMKVTNLRELGSLNHLYKVAKSIGVFDALNAQGAKVGDTLNIDGVDFEMDELVVSKSF